MKKLLSLFLALAMCLSLTACGGSSDSTASTPASTPAPAPSENAGPAAGQTAEPDSSSSQSSEERSDTLMDLLEFYDFPEDLSGYAFTFVGGCVDGKEMETDEVNGALELYGGTMQIVFEDEANVSLVQGGGTLSGIYSYKLASMLDIRFNSDSGELVYAGCLTMNGDTPVLVLFSDDTWLNAMYLSLIDEG